MSKEQLFSYKYKSKLASYLSEFNKQKDEIVNDEIILKIINHNIKSMKSCKYNQIKISSFHEPLYENSTKSKDINLIIINQEIEFIKNVLKLSINNEFCNDNGLSPLLKIKNLMKEELKKLYINNKNNNYENEIAQEFSSIQITQNVFSFFNNNNYSQKTSKPFKYEFKSSIFK